MLPEDNGPVPPPVASFGKAGTKRQTVQPPEGNEAASTEQFNCPNCGGTIELKAAGYTMSVACQYCGSILDVTDPDVKIITRYEEEVRKLELPLGSRGKLRGVEWEVIGYMRRSENGAYPWDEYLLFNPYYGYRFLDTDGRGWTLGKQLTAMPNRKKILGFEVDGEVYEPFYAQTAAQVDYVLGEFYWRVARGEEVHTADYVRPGKMLSWEENARETVWTVGELLEPQEMADAFGIDTPRGKGLPMPHEPSPYRKSSKAAMKIMLAAMAAIVVLSIMFGGTTDPQTQTISLATDGAEQTAKMGPIELTRPVQAVTVSAQAPGIENSWIDLDYTLVNIATGDEYVATNVVERYSGRDSEGNWSEGSRGSSSKFSMIPSGRYELQVSAAGNRWNGGAYSSSNNAQVEVTISKGATFFSNIIIAILFVLFPALWMGFKHLSFESRRRSDSDYAGGGDD